MSSAPQSRPRVSIRSLFREAVFVGTSDLSVTRCQLDARRCRPGDTFFVGTNSGQQDIAQLELARERGATAFVSESLLPVSEPQCLLPDVRSAYATVTAALSDFPTRKLLTIGVLGSHGKTTASLFVASLMKGVAGRVGYATSLGTSDGRNFAPAWVTNPGPKKLTRWMRTMSDSRVAPAIIEITESMLRNKSLSGQEFDVLVIPSLRPQQRRGRMESQGWEYAIRKSIDLLKGHGMVVYNADDAWLNRWMEANQIPAVSYGLDAAADVQGKRLSRCVGEQTILVSVGNALMPLTLKLPGDHHARHALAAVSVGAAFGLELKEILPNVARLQTIPGRMERVHCDSPAMIYVDQADQPDRLAVALHSIQVTHGRRVTCVAEVPSMACSLARAQFGKVLERGASQVILTQCRHARSSSQKLMWEVLDGCERPAAVQLIPNRYRALELALREANPHDVMLLAGWGANAWTSGEERVVRTDADTVRRLSREIALEQIPQSLSAVLKS